MKERIKLHEYEMRPDDLTRFKEPVNRLASTDNLQDLTDYQLAHRESSEDFVIKHNGVLKQLISEDGIIKAKEI